MDTKSKNINEESIFQEEIKKSNKRKSRSGNIFKKYIVVLLTFISIACAILSLREIKANIRYIIPGGIYLNGDLSNNISDYINLVKDYSIYYKSLEYASDNNNITQNDIDICKAELVDKVKSRQAMFNRFEESIDFIAGELIKKNTLVYRLLVENSQIFLSNYKKIKEQDISSIITNLDVDDSIKTVLQNQCISFTPDNYNELLTQAEIDKYNYCISMINSELNVFCSVNKLSYSSYELKIK